MRSFKIVATVCALAGSALIAGVAHAESRPGALPDLRIARGSRNVAEAWLADPTTRYRHFVLGSPYEAASLVVLLKDGRTLALRLPKSSVFEDRIPRLADLDGDGRDEIVLVHTYLDRGAALAVIAVRGDQLKIIAETPPTGAPHRWLNPAGIADFDGDGRLDIAYVQMPHVLGRLRVWTLRPEGLKEIATLDDTANHVAGSRQLGLAAVTDFDGDGVADLAIPSRDRRSLRFIAFKGGVRELARKTLPSRRAQGQARSLTGPRPTLRCAIGGGLPSGPPSPIGRGGNRPRQRTRSYMTIAPAMARLMQKLEGMRTTQSHRCSNSGESEPRSGPST
jgi:FG-GAP-like repeat